MNNMEVVLGASIVLFSVLSMLLSLSVVPSREYPGKLTYSSLAHLSILLFPLLLLAGFVTIGHAAYRNRHLELGLGIATVLWAGPTWLWVALCLYDASSPYIKGSLVMNLVGMILPISVGVFLGFALVLDGLRMRNTSK